MTRKKKLRWALNVCAIRIDESLHELGVPQPGYPAPVANAVENLTRALVVARGVLKPTPPGGEQP